MPAPQKTHVVKSWANYFETVAQGERDFDVRRDDRMYEVGDQLEMHEYEPGEKVYTGRKSTRRIKYILRDAVHFGLQPGYCVLGLAAIPLFEDLTDEERKAISDELRR